MLAKSLSWALTVANADAAAIAALPANSASGFIIFSLYFQIEFLYLFTLELKLSNKNTNESIIKLFYYKLCLMLSLPTKIRVLNLSP
jgi:hypothetical protein